MTSSSIRRSIAALLLWIGLAEGAACDARTIWPGGAKAAVVLTYDDALDSQLDNVVPVLDAAGLKGTFFLSNVQDRDVARWRAVAAEGHELGNHTIFHACAAGTVPSDPRFTTETYTPDTMVREIVQANVLLTALDGRAQHGFATPCGQSVAGGRDYLETLRRAGIAPYVRGVVTTPADLAANVGRIDPFHVPSRGFGEGTTTAQLIDLAQQAEAGGGWAVYLFHGVGGDYLTVSNPVHRAFVAWLAAHKGEIWVTTLSDALAWARQHPG